MIGFHPFRLDIDNQWRRRDNGDDERLLPPKAYAVLRILNDTIAF
jgi:hypothetical protein